MKSLSAAVAVDSVLVAACRMCYQYRLQNEQFRVQGTEANSACGWDVGSSVIQSLHSVKNVLGMIPDSGPRSIDARRLCPHQC